jgi:hypothetical protein
LFLKIKHIYLQKNRKYNMGKRKLTVASPEYVDLVKDVVKNQTSLGNFIEIEVYNIKKSKKEVIKVQKANEYVELALDKEDVIAVSIYEEAFDMVDEQTKRLWIENAFSQVHYDPEKDNITIGGEPTITLSLGMYHKYKDVIIQKLELAALTLQQIADKEKEKKAAEKALKKSKKK